LKEELAKRGEELVRKDEKLEKVREALTMILPTHTWRILKMSSPKLRESTLKWTSPNMFGKDYGIWVTGGRGRVLS